MTSNEMLREFKVEIDKIDSQSYPEIYDEQIFMYINRAIDELVNTGRRVFERDQIISDNLKSLIPDTPVKILPTSFTDTETLFSLTGRDYLFYIKSYITTSVGDKSGKAQVKYTQQDDIEKVLQDPYNKPKPYKVPITFARNSITAYSTPDFKIDALYLTFVKSPAKVSAVVNCDLDIQLHYGIVNRAVVLAEISLGMMKQETQE